MMKVRDIRFSCCIRLSKVLPHHAAAAMLYWCFIGLAEVGISAITPSTACLSTSGCFRADAAMEAAEMEALEMAEGRMGSQEAAPGNRA